MSWTGGHNKSVNRHLLSAYCVLRAKPNTESQFDIMVCSENSYRSPCAIQAVGRQTQEGMGQWEKKGWN